MKSRLRFLQDSNDAEMEELKTKYNIFREKILNNFTDDEENLLIFSRFFPSRRNSLY